MKHQRYAAFTTIAAIIVVLGIVALWVYYDRRDHSEDAVVLAAAARYRFDPALIKAVMWRESWFNPRARGSHGEIGLMQLTEIAAGEWADAEGVKNFQLEHLLDPHTNAFAGTFYLAKVFKRYLHTDNPIPYALADYNAGRHHVLRWNQGAAATNSAVFLAQMDYPGTKQYIFAIMKRRLHYLPEFARAPK